MLEVRTLIISREGCGYWLGEGWKEPSRAMQMIYILLWVVSTQVYNFIEIHQAVHLRLEHFSVCEENPNKK